MVFDHWSCYHDPTEYEPPLKTPLETPLKKIKEKERNCYQFGFRVPEPPVVGWGLERCINLRLRNMYPSVIWYVNDVYHSRYILTLDPAARAAAGVNQSDASINEDIIVSIEKLRPLRDGKLGYRACCDQIVRAGGIPLRLPTEIENCVTDMLGQPPPFPENPAEVPVFIYSRARNEDRINLKPRYPTQCRQVRLNQALRKVYRCMAIMVNEIWDRENRECHAPPTVAVETNALRCKLRKMNLVANKISLRISQNNEEPLPIPWELSEAVSSITEKILE